MNPGTDTDVIVEEHEQGFQFTLEGKGQYGGRSLFVLSALNAEKMADFILLKKDEKLKARLKGEATDEA